MLKAAQNSPELNDNIVMVHKKIRSSHLSHFIKTYLQQQFFAPFLLRRQSPRRHTVTCVRSPLLLLPFAFVSVARFQLHLSNHSHQESFCSLFWFIKHDTITFGNSVHFYSASITCLPRPPTQQSFVCSFHLIPFISYFRFYEEFSESNDSYLFPQKLQVKGG